MVRRLDSAVNRNAIEEVLELYDGDALLVMEPGRVAKGRREMGNFFQFIFAMDIKAKQLVTHVLETDEIVLFTSRWVAEKPPPDGAC